jgi:hypothetical protein
VLWCCVKLLGGQKLVHTEITHKCEVTVSHVIVPTFQERDIIRLMWTYVKLKIASGDDLVTAMTTRVE